MNFKNCFKLIYFFILHFNCLVYNLYAVAPSEFTFNRSARKNTEISTFDNPTYLGGPDITETFTINSGGYYTLPQNYIFNPIADNVAAIFIDADDVIFNLNGKAIRQKDDNNRTGITGIYIGKGHRNIIIRNGAIHGFSGCGIKADDDSHLLDLFDLTIFRCSTKGLCVDGLSTGTGISGITVGNLLVSEIQNVTGEELIGVSLSHATEVVFENCIVSNLLSSTSDATGYKFTSCEGGLYRSMVSTGLTAGGSAIGYKFDDCLSMIFIDSVAGRNTSTSSDSEAKSVGWWIRDSSDLFFDGCSAYSNVATFTCIGFYLENSSLERLLACQAFTNQSQMTNGIGFYASGGANNVFEDCDAAANNGELHGIGFKLTGSQMASSILNSRAKTDIGSTGTAFGILADNAHNCSFQSNRIEGHVGGAGGFGILDTEGASTTNIILSNICAKNTTNFSPGSPTIPIYSGSLSGTPGPFENISLN